MNILRIELLSGTQLEAECELTPVELLNSQFDNDEFIEVNEEVLIKKNQIAMIVIVE